MVKALVVRTAGTNCDAEMVRAFELSGAGATLVHLDRLIADPARMDEFDLIGFPGGFSYGDDIASGRIFAMRVRERLWPALRRAIARGTPMIGVCNGFQTMVQVGLLPGPGRGEAWPEEAPPPQTVALTENIGARFVDRWVGVTVEASVSSVWTAGLAELASELRASGDRRAEEVMMLPAAHGEGRLVTAEPGVLAGLESGGHVALRYTDNYNGSQGAIAGLCDASGLIFGLMPHPERYLDWTRHPHWTRLGASVRRGPTPGLRMFRSAVAAARAPAKVLAS